jgi:uncharacterized protein YdbL (DUF1318 family)
MHMRTLIRSAGRPFRQTLMLAAVLLLAACVTINVYFPAAEAQEAAKEFVDKVIGDDMPPGDAPKDENKNPPPVAFSPRQSFNPLSLLIGDAHAAPDFNIRTPAVQAIQARMTDRFESSLTRNFDSGALGFTNNGMLTVRDATKIALKDRVAVNQAVADDNRDRDALYREIAVANGHPEWEDEIRATFAKQWVEGAKAGWWYQTTAGAWKQK